MQRENILWQGDAIDGSIELKKCEDAASGINDDAYSLPVQSQARMLIAHCLNQ